MEIKTFSKKQGEILKFIDSADNYLICDGAVRSGKTIVMTLAFVLWAMRYFNETNFAVCGKTVTNAERNIIRPFMAIEGLNDALKISYKLTNRCMTVESGNRRNYFYVYGGKDESSYALIQGITLAGVLLDEVALMPQSFVDQATARTLTFSNAKIWFNCNPESPAHWFYKQWIADTPPRSKRLHFLMTDNPIMGEDEIRRAEEMYAGVFYRRYILGEWVIADGLVFDFNEEKNTFDQLNFAGCRWYMTCDYGITNPFVCQLWAVKGNVAYCVKEYYFDSNEAGYRRTDEEHYDEIEALAGNLPIEFIVIDPSATSMKETIYRHDKFSYKNANNDVIGGIGSMAALLKAGMIKYNKEQCPNTIKEFGLYLWDMNSGLDKPIKENDHGMDASRYFCSTVLIDEFNWINWGNVG